MVCFIKIKKIDEKIYILNKCLIGQGMDDDKTWFKYKDEVYKNVNLLYKILPLNENIRRDIHLLLKSNMWRLGSIVKTVIRIKSLIWKL